VIYCELIFFVLLSPIWQVIRVFWRVSSLFFWQRLMLNTYQILLTFIEKFSLWVKNILFPIIFSHSHSRSHSTYTLSAWISLLSDLI
jgi:hypothetical protein